MTNKRHEIIVTHALPFLMIVGMLLPGLGQTVHAVTATGGDIITNYTYAGTSYRAHIFTNVVTTSLTVTAGGNVEVLVVAGGGGGGNAIAGGGGAGGLIYSSSVAVVSGSNYVVTVGAGGAGGLAAVNSAGANGSNSVFGSLTAYGGGGGPGWNTVAAKGGGSGAGGMNQDATFAIPGAATNGQGNAGGYAYTNAYRSGNFPGGGGGGAGAVGQTPTVNTTGGDGGIGREFPQFAGFGGDTNFPGWFAGGGGGGTINGTPGSAGGTAGNGGKGGGGAAGAGSTTAKKGIAGQANTGGGGGSGSYNGGTYGGGGTGGCGIVIVRYSFVIDNVTATNVTMTTADLIGNLSSTGTAVTTVWAFWDTNNWTTNKTWTYSTNFVADRLGQFTNPVSGLISNQTYFFTYYSSNTEDEVWAQPSLPFKTFGPLSVDNDGGATGIGYTNAILRGTLLNGSAAYATVSWGTNQASLASTSTPTWVTEGIFSVPVTGLLNGVTYYYQSFVSNIYGSALSPTTNFATYAFLGNGSWTNDAAGNWSVAGNWLNGTVADGAGRTGWFTNDITAARTITLDGAAASRTLGVLNIGDASGSHAFTLVANNGGVLTFNNSGTDAQLNQVSTSKGDTNGIPLVLAGDLVVSNASANALAITNGITGTGNLTFNAAAAGGITLSLALVNPAGTITNSGAGTGTTLISGGVGSSVTSITESSTSSALMITNTVLTVNGSGTVLANNSASGSGRLLLSTGVRGTGNLTLNNNGGIADGITVLNLGVTNNGMVINSGIGPGNTLVSAIIGSNVTAVVQNSADSPLILSSVNNFTGVFIKAGTVSGITSVKAFGTNTGVITIGDTSGTANATLNGGFAGNFTNPIVVASGNTGIAMITNSAASIFSGAVTLNNHDLTLSPVGSVLTLSGGITGTGNLTLATRAAGGITLSTLAVNHAGSISNLGTGAGAALISGGVGSNITTIIENSTSSAITVSNLMVNSSGTVLVNNNTSGSAKLTVSGGVQGAGNLVLNNNSAIADGITVSTFGVTNNGMIINSGNGPGNTLISAIIETNVTAVIQNSTNSLLTLSGVNNFAGGLFIKAGTVSGINNVKAFGTNTGVITIGDTSGTANATLSGGFAGNFTNPIVVASGNTGIAMITNSAASIFSGAVTLNNHDLTLSPAGSTLTLSGGITGNGNLMLATHGAGGITLSTLAVNNAGVITNFGDGAGTALISAGVGSNITTIIENSTSSALTVSNLMVNSSGTVLANNNTSGSAKLTVSGGAQGAGNLVLNNNSAIADGITVSTFGITNNGMIINSGIGPGNTLISAIIGTNVTGVFQYGTNSQLTLSGANTFTNGLFIKAGTVSGITSVNAFGANSNMITLGDSSGSANVILHCGSVLNYSNPIAVAANNTGIACISNTANSSTFSGPITLYDHDLSLVAANHVTFNGGISGSGNLLLYPGSSYIKLYSPGKINNSGTISVTGAGVGIASAVQITGGVGSNVTVISINATNAPLVISAVPLEVNSNGTVLANNNIGGTAVLTLSGGANGTGNLVLSNNSAIADGIALSSVGVTNRGMIINAGAGPGNTAISAIIGTNVTAVVQNSANSFLNLSGANTYDCDTLISNGTLKVGVANTIPDGAGKGNVLVNGTFDVNNADTINGLSGNGVVDNSTASARILTVGNNNQTSTFSGIITNSGAVASLALTKTGSGTLTLTSANGYGGLTTVGAGVLNIQNGSALGTTNGATTVTAGGALQLQGGIATLTEGLTLNGMGVANDGALRSLSSDNSYNGAITLGSASRINSDAGTLTLVGTIGGAGSLFFGGAGNISVTNVIGTGAGTLIKDGSGTVTLSGTNAYTGATTVSNGTLLVDGSLCAGGGTVTVMTNGVLGGTGVISRAVTIAAGAADSIGGGIAPGGTNVGILTINGNFTLVPTNVVAQQPVWSVQLSETANDLLVVNGSFIMATNGLVTLKVGNAGVIPNNRTFTLMTWTNANPVGNGTQFQVVSLDPNWSGGTVMVDTNAKQVVLGGLLDRIANIGATNVTDTTADLVCNLTSTGTAVTTVWAFWDTTDQTTNKTWAYSSNFVATSLGYITNSISGLTPNQTNYFTYYVSNTTGEVWAQPSLSFKTWGPLSVDNDGGATNIGYTFATLRGTLLDGNGAYAMVRWGTSEISLTSTSTPVWVAEGVFSVPVTGLVNNTTYYYQCLVTNVYGTATAASITNFMTWPVGFIYVATNGPADGDGSSWALALTNIQTAIDAAAEGDTIYIAGHSFSNDAGPLRSHYVWTNKALTILGGYAADGGIPGALTNTPTILTSTAGSTNRILYISGLTSGTLQRVTITGGKGSSSGAGGPINGSGLYIAASSNLTVVSCVVSNNKATGSQGSTTYGGGICLVGSEARLTGCHVVNNTVNSYNTATYGGGIYMASGSLTISNSVISGNQAGSGTGSGPQPRFGYGGGVSFAGGALTMWNTLVAGNVGRENDYSLGLTVPSDGIYAGNGSATLVNCTVAYNNKAGIRYVAGTVTLTNTIVWGHTTLDATGTVTLTYCDIGVVAGTGVTTNNCISADPLFVNTGSGDYRLQTLFSRWSVAASNWVHESLTSPCIDAGTNQDWMASATDLDGLPRLSRGIDPPPRVDMGAYEAMPNPASLQILIANVAATNVLDSAADLIGDLTATGTAATTVWVFWDTNNCTTNKTWTYSTNFLAGSLGLITNPVSGLLPNQTYFFAYYGSNTDGATWAEPSLPFKTWGPPAVDTDGGATDIWTTNATLRGTLLNGNGAYATIMWGESEFSLASTSTPVWVTEGVFSIPVTGLMSNTAYYYQCFVSNVYGTATSVTTNFHTKLFLGVWYAATNGPAGGDGLSWAQAFTNLQTAIDRAFAGNTIYVAGHTFSNSTARLNSKYAWTNKPLTILGGYAADGGTPGALTNISTILTVASGDTENRILYISGVTNGTLQRVILTGAYCAASYIDGAGLYIAASSNLTLESCVVSNNATDGYQDRTTYGGGIYLVGSAVGLTRCDVILNRVHARAQASYGGGIHVASGRLAISNCVIRGNAAGQTFGSTFKYQPGYGGAVSLAGGALTMGNTLVAGNVATLTDWLGNTYAGSDGIDVGNNSASLVNCTIANNAGIGLYGAGGSSVGVTNSILWNNGLDVTGTVTLTYCDIGAAGVGVTTNNCLSTDPLFVDTTYYHLQSKRGNYVGGYFSDGSWSISLSNSPCIDAGDTNSPYALEPFFNGRRVNMGAYGNTPVASLSMPPAGTIIMFY